VHARHILVRVKGSTVTPPAGKTELSDEEALAKAQDIRKKILAGEDFAALAKAESDDAVTGTKGGDLGVFKHGQMVPEFEQAAFTLPVGQVSEPVKTKFGYHLIQVVQGVKTFDQLRPEIEKRMRPDLARESVETLRKQVPVTMDDSFFGSAPPLLQPVK
jgi:parvulin-like peptidyl-prolyl isomerase